MRPIYVTASSTGTLGPINLDTNQSPFNVSVGVIYSSTAMTGTYGVQFTLDDQQVLTNTGSTRALTWIDDANLPTGTSSGNQTTNYMFPVAAVRCVISAVSSGSITLAITQGGPG